MPAAVRLEGEGGGVFVDADAQLEAGALQPPGQLCRVEHRDAAAVVQAYQEGRGVDLLADRFRVQEFGIVGEALALQLAVPVVEFLGLVRFGGDVDLAGALELAVKGVAGDRALDRVEVAGAQLLQFVDLVGPAGEAVGQSVGERGGAETAVAARGGPAHLAALHQHHVPLRVALFRDQRGPQSAVTAADDQQIAGLGAGERGFGVGLAGVVQPVRDRPGFGKGLGPACHGARGHDFNSLQG